MTSLPSGRGARETVLHLAVEDLVIRVSVSRDDRQAEAWRDGRWAPIPMTSGEVKRLVDVGQLSDGELRRLGIPSA